MKVLLDIKDSKAASLLEVLSGLSYVKAETLSGEKIRLKKEIKEAIEEVRLHKEGKIKLKSLDAFLNEL